MIRTIEELSLNAWPSLQTLLIDGWVLRFAEGYTRRANSVYPLYPSQGGTTERIVACERRYRSRGLPVVFKMTTACFPPELDDLLAARGYQSEAHTSVQLASLTTASSAPAGDVSLTSQASAEWLDAFAHMHVLSAKSQSAHQRMLDLIAPPTCYAALHLEGQTAACGLAVLQDGFIGFFDIITDPAFRRRGCAEQVMLSLMAWGKRQGAHTAYLQVMLNNPPALALYEKLGFHEAYRYWYRVNS